MLTNSAISAMQATVGSRLLRQATAIGQQEVETVRDAASTGSGYDTLTDSHTTSGVAGTLRQFTVDRLVSCPDHTQKQVAVTVGWKQGSGTRAYRTQTLLTPPADATQQSC